MIAVLYWRPQPLPFSKSGQGPGYLNLFTRPLWLTHPNFSFESRPRHNLMWSLVDDIKNPSSLYWERDKKHFQLPSWITFSSLTQHRSSQTSQTTTLYPYNLSPCKYRSGKDQISLYGAWHTVPRACPAIFYSGKQLGLTTLLDLSSIYIYLGRTAASHITRRFP